MTDGAPTTALRRAKALADPSRVRILDLVAAASRAGDPITVYELADATGLHHTAVRQHLAKLLDADLVDEQRLEPSGGRGRPRLTYAVRPGTAGGGPYQVLAGLLADAVRTGRSPRDVGRDAGERVATRDDDTIEQLTREAARIGFDPTVHRRSDGTVDLVLHTCPFAELAGSDPATVCDLHLGLAEGLVGRAGGVVVDDLHVADPHRGGCRLTLRPA